MSLASPNIPVATKLLLDVARKIDESPIKSVYLVYCPPTGSKGTAFLVSGDRLVTCKHVIQGEDPKNIRLQSALGQVHMIKDKVEDPLRDLSLLTATDQLGPGLTLHKSDLGRVGEHVWTWGYPLGYNGPPPLLSVGYLSGYSHHSDPPSVIPQAITI